MILVVDIGNTQTKVGLFDQDELLVYERLSTDAKKTDTEYSILINYILESARVRPEDIQGGALSSVVPPVNHYLYKAIKRVTGHAPIIVDVEQDGVQRGCKLLACADHDAATHLLFGFLKDLNRRNRSFRHRASCALERIFHLVLEPGENAHGFLFSLVPVLRLCLLWHCNGARCDTRIYIIPLFALLRTRLQKKQMTTGFTGRKRNPASCLRPHSPHSASCGELPPSPFAASSRFSSAMEA